MLLPTTGILIADNITGHTIYRIMGLNKCKSVSNFNQKNRVMVMDYLKKTSPVTPIPKTGSDPSNDRERFLNESSKRIDYVS